VYSCKPIYFGEAANRLGLTKAAAESSVADFTKARREVISTVGG
jgi:hypothetical protein